MKPSASSCGAHRRDDPRAVDEQPPRVLARDQIELAVAIARLDVGEAVVLVGRRAQRLGEHLERSRRAARPRRGGCASPRRRRRSGRRGRATSAARSAPRRARPRARAAGSCRCDRRGRGTPPCRRRGARRCVRRRGGARRFPRRPAGARRRAGSRRSARRRRTRAGTRSASASRSAFGLRAALGDQLVEAVPARLARLVGSIGRAALLGSAHRGEPTRGRRRSW